MTGDASGSRPTWVAVVNDFDVVVHGVAQMLAPFPAQIKVVESLARERVEAPVDVALYDAFATGEAHADRPADILANPQVRHLAIYTWNTDPALVEVARRRGFGGYLSKSISAERLADALVAIGRGEHVVDLGTPGQLDGPERAWPGQEHGLTEAEAEVLSFIAQGASNAEIADRLHIGPDAVKSRIRNAYRRIDVTDRVNAVLWAIDHGLRPKPSLPGR